MPKAARTGDPINHGGSIESGSQNVTFNNMPAARANLDRVSCSKHPGKPSIICGSATVFINGMPAARMNDQTSCRGSITEGSPNIIIGGGSAYAPGHATTETSALKGIIFGLLASGVVVWEGIKISTMDAIKAYTVERFIKSDVIKTAVDKGHTIYEAKENIHGDFEEKAKRINERILEIKKSVDSW